MGYYLLCGAIQCRRIANGELLGDLERGRFDPQFSIYTRLPKTIGLQNGNLFVFRPQSIFAADSSFVGAVMMEMTDAGSLVWQSRAVWQTGSANDNFLPPSPYSRLASDDQGNIFIGISIGPNIQDPFAPHELIRVNNGSVVWWRKVWGTMYTLQPDGLGGVYYDDTNTIVHVNAAGTVDKAVDLTWPGNFAHIDHVDIDASGNVRAVGPTQTTNGWAVAMQLLDQNLNLLEARTYSPIFYAGGGSTKPLELSNGHTLICTPDRIMALDANGDPLSAHMLTFPFGTLSYEQQSANDRILVNGQYITTDFFGNQTYSMSINRLQEDLSTYCQVQPYTITRGDPPLSMITVQDVTTGHQATVIPFSSSVAGFTITSLPLPTTTDLCAAVVVPEQNATPSATLSSTLLPSDGHITLTSTVVGRYTLLDARGKVCSTGRLNPNGTTLLSGSGLSQGIYILRADDQNGRLIDATKLMVE